MNYSGQVGEHAYIYAEMSLPVIIISIIVLAVITLIAYRIFAFNKASRLTSLKIFERIRPLYEMLEKGQQPSTEEIYAYAKNMLTRETTFRLLHERNLATIFPPEFYTIEKAAESNLANWLEFPTELDACPDEIEHVKRVTIDFDGEQHYVHYEVFKFRMQEPHWAAGDGWLLGVVGPYFDDSQPYDFPHSTFSRLSSRFSIVSADDEARWVHNRIAKRRV